MDTVRAIVCDTTNTSMNPSSYEANKFDYTQSNLIYPDGFGIYNLSNGDVVYGSSTHKSTTGRPFGALFNGNNTTINAPRVNVSIDGVNYLYIYYEPFEYVYVDKVTWVKSSAHGTNQSITEISVYTEDSQVVPTTGLIPSLPYGLLGDEAGNMEVSFDRVVIGPNRPLKVVIECSLTTIYATELLLEYTGA